MSLVTQLQKHFNIVFSIYRKTATIDYSGDVPFTLLSASNDGYMSTATKREINDNGEYIAKVIYRLRTLPLDIAADDRVVITDIRGTALTGDDRQIFQVNSYEDFDMLASEAVSEMDRMNKNALSELP